MNTKMFKIVAIVLGVVVVLVGAWFVFQKKSGEKTSTAVLRDPKTYTDLSNGLSIQRPSDWIETSSQAGSISFAHETGSNVTVVVEQLGDDSITLDEYTEKAMAGIQQLDLNFQLITSYDSKTAGYPSKTIEYTIQGESLTVRAKGVWFIKNAKAYVFTFTAPEDIYSTYEPTGTAIIESVKVQ